MADPLLPEDPARVGSYELVGRLGDGGQGSVYLGRDRHGREVAIKLLHARFSRDPAARSRFVRELEVASRVSGFCTARVLDADIHGDRPYIVSEFVRGPALVDLVRNEGPMDAAALLRLAIGTATALVAIHRAEIVHRDFKPPNVLIGPGGPRVIDFGIARALDSSAITMTSQMVGTPGYMAPEQVAGDTVGPAADVFAWGGTMLFAATGRPPFGADSIPAVLHRVVNAEADLSPLPGPLAELVGSCLAKDPARRPTSSDVLFRLLEMAGATMTAGEQAGDLLERGATLLTEVSLESPPSQLTRRGARPARHRLLVAATPVILAGLAILVPTVIFQMRSQPKSVIVGLIAPLTGLEADFSIDIRDGVALAMDEYKAGKPPVPVRLVYYDTHGTDEGARQAAQRAVSDGVAAVIGPKSDSETMQVAPILESRQIPSVSPVAGGRALVRNGWRFWHTMAADDEDAVRGLADMVTRRARRTDKIVVLDDKRDDSPYAAAEFTSQVEDAGKTVERLSMPPRPAKGTADYSGVVERMKKLKPDVVFFGGSSLSAGPLIKQARKAGFDGKFYLTESSLTTDLAELAGNKAVEGTVLSCSCISPPKAPDARFPQLYDELLQRFEKAHKQPGGHAPESYDAAWSILHALQKGKRTGRDINAFLRIIDEPGATQWLHFGPFGEPIGTNTYIYQWQGGLLCFIGDSRSAPIE
jgi:ABC-type branched-subunit amino acid transport system substrate-binding protein